MFRKGHVPRRGEQTELCVHAWTRKGFFGTYANLYKTRNPGEPIRWDKGLGPCALDPTRARPDDGERPDGGPAPLLTNGDVTLSLSRRAAPMPFCWRNADADELYFIHRGPARFETEMGSLTAEPGDLVYLPRNMVYRVTPAAEDSIHLILETQGFLEPADRYHREHGETSSGLDLSLIEVPEPGESTGPRRDEYEVRTRVGGEIYSAFFDYDPVGVTVGWSGDPIVFKLSAWDVPSARLPSTPPTAAVFLTDDWGCVVTVHTPMPMPGSAVSGPPAHTNDYDEIWFLHSTGSPERAARFGLIRWEPQGVTQPGARRSRGDAVRWEPDPKALNLNIDVRHRLRLTGEAQAYVVEAPAAVGATA